MMKKISIILILISLCCGLATAQNETLNSREVTLYNPYKPELPEIKKKNQMPVIKQDSVRQRQVEKYDIQTTPYYPAYSINPLKAAVIAPDPLPKLYKGFVNIGAGNYFTPFAEVGITNSRSKKGAVGLYAGHVSSSGKIKLENDDKVYAGYMDNHVYTFGKKFFKKNILAGSVDYSRKTRHAYGYDTAVVDNEEPYKKQIRLGYQNIGANLSIASSNSDSSAFSYDFDFNYNLFLASYDMHRHNIAFAGKMAKKIKGLYAGADLNFDYFRVGHPDELLLKGYPEYMGSVSPFVSKNKRLWSFRLGLQVLVDKREQDTLSSGRASLFLYPDVNFRFSIMPDYIDFFAQLSGKMEKNDPQDIIEDNPYLLTDGSLFVMPHSNHRLVASAGFKGNNGIGGNYLVNASYSMIEDMPFYANFYSNLSLSSVLKTDGRYFRCIADDVDLLHIHGEMNGDFTKKISFNVGGNYYQYTTTLLKEALGKPDWDANFGLGYNLRNKILATMDVKAIGERNFGICDSVAPVADVVIVKKTPVHVHLNMGFEYRYTKILSFWIKAKNISINRYYDWAFYPTQRFQIMAGLTYSL